MKNRSLHFNLFLMMFLFIGTISSIAQTVDTTNVFDPAITTRQLVYAEVTYHKLDENDMNGAFVLSPVEIAAFGDYSAAVAFYNNGVEARNQNIGGFSKDNDIVPVDGQIMKLWFGLDMETKTFKAWAQTGDMEVPLPVNNEYLPFRNVNVDTDGINRWSTFHYANEDSLSVQKVELQTSSDATLYSITSDIGELSPTFSPTTLEYELIVPFGTTEVNLNSIATSAGSTIELFDDLGNDLPSNGVIPFSGDGVLVDMYVTAWDGTVVNYVIDIFVDEGTSDATLSGIDLSVSAVDPAFDGEITSYTAIIPAGTTSVDITGIPNFPEATVIGGGTISISEGTGSATLNVSSQDGESSMSYTVNFIEADGSNYALSLPGEDGELSNVDISGINITSLPFTIEMWIKPEGSQTANAGLFFNRPGNIGLQYCSGWQGSNLLRFMTTEGEGDTYGSPALTSSVTQDQWHHVAVVMTEQTRTIYLDGVASTEEATFSTIDFASGTTYIGYDSNASAKAFKGLIDEIRVWSDSISPDDLNANKLEILNGDEANLVAYYNFDLNSENVTPDLASDFHGKLTGGTYTSSFSRNNFELSSLTVSEGTLYPEYSPGVYEYVVVLPKETASFNIAATPVADYINISGDGTISTTDGFGSFTITATTADETESKEFVIHYTVETDLELAHSYTFADGTAKDVVGNAHGTVIGGSITEGIYTADEQGEYIEFDAAAIGINQYASATIELYVNDEINTQNLHGDGSINTNTMISYLGGAEGSYGVNYLFTSLNCKTSISTNNISSPWSSENAVSTDGINLSDDTQKHHIVTTINSDSICLYVDGFIVGVTQLAADNKLAYLSNDYAYLMKSGYANDSTFLGTVLEYNIYKGQMDEQTIAIRAYDYPVDTESTDATLSDLTLDDLTIDGFNPGILEYNIEVESLPTTVTPTPKVEGATAVISTEATTIPGTTTILVTAVDGNTNTYTINYDVVTAVNEVKDLGIKVYPTVSNGSFTVTSEGASTVVTIYSLTGKLIEQLKTNSAVENFNVDHKGMYIVKVNSDGVTKLFKVIKK